MTISLLQLNINADNFWGRLIPFLSSHDFDIIHLQEVTGKETRCGNFYSKRDTFAELQNLLNETHNGELSITQRYTSNPHSYFGNATFYKKAFSLLEKKEIVLFHNTEFFPSDAKTFEGVGRKLLHLKLAIYGKSVSFLNTHFAWGPTPVERPYQTEQGDKIVAYLKTVNKSFVFSGDMNLTVDQPTIQKLGEFAVNLTQKKHITNTLNPRLHNVKQLFPLGLAVDYIFLTEDITVESFAVLEDDISDHFGLTAVLEI
ncbi:MAG: endonuclease/exonuclease/phosphatase family protein [Candidatus Levyibacteriota bacterium]